MKAILKPLLPLGLLALGGPALAVEGGPIGTLQIGSYLCERPGDAAGPAGLHVPEEDFAVVNASSYAVGDARGSYLRTGDTVVMTSGPKRGQRFRHVSPSFLRMIGDDGAEGPMRCVRRGRGDS